MGLFRSPPASLAPLVIDAQRGFEEFEERLRRNNAGLGAGIAHGAAKALALGPRVGQPHAHPLIDGCVVAAFFAAVSPEELEAWNRAQHAQSPVKDAA